MKPTAFVTMINGATIGTADHFKTGEWFEITGKRGNVCLFYIDEILEKALTMKDASRLNYARSIYKDIHSKIGLCVGFPLLQLVNDVATEFGDDAVVALNRSDKNPDDRRKD